MRILILASQATNVAVIVVSKLYNVGCKTNLYVCGSCWIAVNMSILETISTEKCLLAEKRRVRRLRGSRAPVSTSVEETKEMARARVDAPAVDGLHNNISVSDKTLI